MTHVDINLPNEVECHPNLPLSMYTVMCYTHKQNPHKSTEATYVHHNFPFPHTVPPPGVTVTSVTTSQVVYETTPHSSATRVIAGYEVIRFEVPMIGQYVNTGRGRRVTISPAVPGAQYRITAWALGNGTRSATPALEYATTAEASEFSTECILDLQFVHRHKKYSIMHTRTLRVIFCAHTVRNTI